MLPGPGKIVHNCHKGYHPENTADEGGVSKKIAKMPQIST
jgi:hypothetical protein